MAAQHQVDCPVCQSPDDTKCLKYPLGSRDASLFACEICGEFEASRTALHELENYPQFTPKIRTVLSHRLRASNDAGRRPPMLKTYDLEALVKSKPMLPSPSVQALNIIRFIGDRVLEKMGPLKQAPDHFHASIGSASRELAMRLTKELVSRGLVSGIDASSLGGSDVFDLDLTLSGWQEFEAEKRGQSSGSYGFIALKFGDPILDPFLADVIKPAVSELGYTLEDMRDAARAGVIDNVMRARIRDAAFVLVDLTHANEGAYWEAGYAEGLGKPVLYLCKRDVFRAKGTHFDTNHCTTVQWEPDDSSKFVEELTATLRNSLGT